jgi:peptidoglycan/LPS O-acetylase OafA/YrhL
MASFNDTSLLKSGRIYYMDNARAFASIAGFFYHAMYVFARHWHINVANPDNGSDLGIIIDFLNTFRMPMFLVFSGFFTGYMLEKYKTTTFVQKRIGRILLPFVSCLVLLIPIQLYFELSYKYGNWWYLHFWEMANPASPSFSLMHLWFLYHILIYTVLLVVIVFLKSRLSTQRMGQLIPANGWFYMAAWLLLSYILYRMGKTIDHSLGLHTAWLSFYDIGVFLPFFLFGVHFFIHRDVYESQIIRGNNHSIVILVLLIALSVVVQNVVNDFSSVFVIVNKWLHLLLVLNLFKRLLNFTSDTLSYLANASYPVYILHQPVIIIVSFFSIGYLNGPMLYWHYVLLVLASAAVTYGVYELLVRRFAPGRIILTGIDVKKAVLKAEVRRPKKWFVLSDMWSVNFKLFLQKNWHHPI